MSSLFLHHLEKHRKVQRDNRNHGAGTCHQSLVHGHIGFALQFLLEFRIEFLGSRFQVLLGTTDGTVAVNRMRKFRTDVGIGHRLDTFGKHAGILQLTHPKCPVFTTHHLHGVGSLFFCSGFCADGADSTCHAVDGRTGESFANRLQHAAIKRSVVRIHAHTGCHAINQQIYLAAHFVQSVNHVLTHFMRERITIERYCIEARFMSELVESHIVVPTRSSALLARFIGTFFFEGYTNGGSTEFKSSRNTASKSITGRASQHQNRFRSIFWSTTFSAFLLYVFNLALHIHCAALGVCIHAHIAANHRFNDHLNTSFLNFLFTNRAKFRKEWIFSYPFGAYPLNFVRKI